VGGGMNAMILRHYWIRLRMVAQDPVALSMLALAGLASLLPTHRISIRMLDRNAEAAAIAIAISLQLLLLLVWVPLAALPVAGTRSRSVRSTASGRVLPALPIGPRSRALAEALAALTLVLLARTPALLLYGTDIGRFGLRNQFFGDGFSGFSLFCAVFLRESLLFALFALPLLIAWCAIPRLDGAGLARTTLLTMIVTGATLAGLASRPLWALAFSAVLSTMALLGLEWNLPGRRAAGPRSTAPVAPMVIPWRPSPGPLGQFRRDQLFGPLFRPGVYRAVGVAIPLALAFQAATGGRRAGMGMALTAFLLLLSANLLVFPIGVRLVPSSGVGAASLFSGHFSDAWAALPVRREQVLRAVYAHAWVVSCLVCLCFCSIVMSNRGASSALLFELPGLPLTAAFVLCAAAGDRPRGSLALGCLLAFQFVIPVMSMAVYAVGLRDASPSGLALYLPGYILALIGGLPPLIHLRAPRPLARAAA
jgi:hypothetical protein